MAAPDRAYDVPDLCPDLFDRGIVMIDLWQLLCRYFIGGKEACNFLFAHDFMVRHHDMFQYTQFGAQWKNPADGMSMFFRCITV